jgi:aminoglycoside phosphotransferase family enzyme
MTGTSGTVVETHVSVLFLHDDVALKFKKALRLPFLDFTTAAWRRLACEAEVEANRRLAPDVYLGVAPLVLDGRVLPPEPPAVSAGRC